MVKILQPLLSAETQYFKSTCLTGTLILIHLIRQIHIVLFLELTSPPIRKEKGIENNGRKNTAHVNSSCISRHTHRKKAKQPAELLLACFISSSPPSSFHHLLFYSTSEVFSFFSLVFFSSFPPPPCSFIYSVKPQPPVTLSASDLELMRWAMEAATRLHKSRKLVAQSYYNFKPFTIGNKFFLRFPILSSGLYSLCHCLSFNAFPFVR